MGDQVADADHTEPAQNDDEYTRYIIEQQAARIIQLQQQLRIANLEQQLAALQFSSDLPAENNSTQPSSPGTTRDLLP
ncbi:MAG: hypothetical protein KA508_00870 [Gammaproteobacteria bacterium]|nr:hypothetical protein [Gammaproteobacteria bacterium]